MSHASASDYDFVEKIVSQSKSSFSIGMKVLPPEQRGYLFAVYAYARKLDDIADDLGEPAQKNQHLDIWVQKVANLKEAKADCEITRILLDAHDQLGLPLDELDLLIDGMRLDIEGPIIAPDWQQLYHYCRRVAVSVGLLSLPLFGRTDDGAIEFAHETGYALQLTNILRDVLEDAEIGRLYLPKELLDQYGLPHNPEHISNHTDLKHVLNDLGHKAEGHYEKASYLLGQIGKQNLKPAILMMIVYQKTFEKMQKRGLHILSPRMRLSKGEKAMIVMKSLTRL